jgi:hypothetical protein
LDVKFILAEIEVTADVLANVSTGAAVSVTVIDVDCGEAVKVVCAFPVVSVIENEPETETAIVAVAVSPTKAAVDIAVIVQTVGEV